MVENDKGVVKEYTLYKNPEGKMVAKNIEWHKANGTYTASYIIGAMIVTIGILVLAGIWSPTLGLVAAPECAKRYLNNKKQFA